jgi:hypothetical protein
VEILISTRGNAWHAGETDGVIDDPAFHPQNANWLATAGGDDAEVVGCRS